MRFDFAITALALLVVLAAWLSDRSRSREPIGAHTALLFVPVGQPESFGSLAQCEEYLVEKMREAELIGVPAHGSCTKDIFTEKTR